MAYLHPMRREGVPAPVGRGHAVPGAHGASVRPIPSLQPRAASPPPAAPPRLTRAGRCVS